jgi:hypothetical protein
MSDSTVPGSYTETSQDIRFAQNPGGSGALSAQCKKMDGSWSASTLQYDVANMNGVLTPQPGGSYQLTARNIRMTNGSDGVYLVAECQKRDGSWVESKLKIQDIANIDGTLKYGG